MALTTTSNIIIPEVLAPMVAAAIPGQLAIAGTPAVTTLDNLKGMPFRFQRFRQSWQAMPRI